MTFEKYKIRFQKKQITEFENSIIETPIVSISVVTYNQKKYIKECLDSILMQQTTFPFEIILGEDESNDGTREICKAYADKHSDKIKLFLRSRKDVIYINGNATGRYNFIENLKSCSGKYIALCEGDDYWTDPLKLQKQVYFLEANPEYSLCFHNVKIYNEEEKTFQKDTITRTVNETTGEEDLAKGNYIQTPSVVLRNDFEIPSWFNKVSLGDWSLYMLSIKGRKVYKFEEEMAVYRLHSKSIWSKLDQEKRDSLTRANMEVLYKNLKLRSNTKNILRNRLGFKVKKSLLKKILNKLKQKISRFV